ncbi:exodeoxyribonuclease V subunit gamma [Catenuloplanes japonicus]|uniref:exodeoxyribonuclease V subunit gamma n=1 Tax=Catenuloplanes japonicus TaxID=33876 RepID=UPI000524B929|nr:exodeoxyribonuclease V subunit gamma [Catenuloplanes japonicus]
MLRVHRAERADRLAEALAGVLREPPGDPFAPEVVAVPSRGVERWLAQRLSHHLGAADGRGDGVCANVGFPSVTELIARVGAAVGGPGRAEDPWRPAHLVWVLLDVIDHGMSEAWCRRLRVYLGADDADDVRRGRRYATAWRLARLFDSYGLHRPDMITAWAGGDDADGLGGHLPDDLHWQAELWRRVRKHQTVPSPAERLTDLCDVLRREPDRAALPARVSVFGPTRLPAAHVTVLAALGDRRDVHLWLPHPSPALWDRVAPHATALHGPVARATDPTRDLPRHPLLASLGRDARELQLTLAGAATVHHPAAPRPDTLLGRLQQAIADDVPVDASAGGLQTAPRPAPETDDARLPPDRAPAPVATGAADRSVQVHACHGPVRQVEVLREVILGLLAADETLEPRDMLVMCPDIETFAPLISASFGLGAALPPGTGHPAHRLRVRLADRALLQVNPLFGVAGRLLALAHSRVTAAEVLDLIAEPPVRRRFALDDDDLDRLRDLVVRSGVRWGLDPEHRARYRLDVRPNTWAAGLDRILLGVAMSEDELCWLGTALPLDDVDSTDADLAGRLAEIVDRLSATLTALRGEHPLTGWIAAIRDGVHGLTSVPDADAWQAARFDAELADVVATAGAHARTVPLGGPDVDALLEERLSGRPTRANFRTGDLTMCTMVPMRSVPHRVVCVLGLDDDSFPRGSGRDGDDVLGRTPCAGERDPRSEDRQLLLDAVTAATEHLILCYSGADERTNASRPPAVPLAEIVDVLRAPVTRHPLQAFDARNFTDLRSFDRDACAGAEAAAGPRRDDPRFLDTPLPAPPVEDVIRLDDLRHFLDDPVGAFLRRRLGISFFADDEDPADGLPVELDELEKWGVGDRLLRARLAGADLSRCVQAEWRRGVVPPGPLGARLLDTIGGDAERLATAALPHLTGLPDAHDLEVTLPGGRRVAGTVGSLHGDVILSANYARLGPKHRLRAWLALCALTAGVPGRRWRAVTIGRDRFGAAPRRSTLGPIGHDVALRVLADLAALWDEGMRAPLPMAMKTSHAYAEGGLEHAKKEWNRFEAHGSAATMVWAGRAIVADDRFGELALRVWEPLRAAETLDRP